MKDRTEILFENQSLIAIDKPSGILSVPDRHNPDKFSIASWITRDYPDARPLHRLDFETSGILMFCLLPEAFGWYSDQFEQRAVHKTYIAIVEGRLHADEGMIEKPLFTMSNGRVIISKRGKESITHWKLLENFSGHACLEANPATGRTHQIRVHLSSIGHPILCDTTYGAKGPFYLSSVKGKHRYRLGKDEESERPLISRTALHAAKIAISDYHSQEMIRIESPVAKDMQVVLKKLRQHASIR